MSALPPVQKADYDAFLDRDNDERVLRYMLRLRTRYRFVNTLGLPEFADHTDFPIENLYVRQGVRWEQPARGHDKAREGRTPEPELLAAAKKRVVLLGDAGSGKSTFVTWLTWTLCERGRNALHERIGGLVPLTFVLRDLPITDETTTWRALVDLLRSHPTWTDGLDEILGPMAQAGQLMVLVDGWDEVGDTRLRRALRRALLDGMARYPRCSFVLTSRPLGYDEVPLDADDSIDAGVVRATLEPFDEPRIRAFVQAWYGWRAPDEAAQRAAELLDALRQDPRLLGLAGNPNLLGMLALVHRRFAALPRGRSELLARVTDAFLEGWEAAKGLPRPTAPLIQRRRWLQELALRLNRRRVWGASRGELAEQDPDGDVDRLQSGTVIERTEAVQALRPFTQERPGHRADDLDVFLDWCIRRSGLLVPRSETRIAFAHLSFQDWLAAGAFLERLRGGWADPPRAERAASELSRWVMRAAGGPTVVMVLDVLRQEQPEMATRLGDEVFAERAASYKEHLRLAEAYREVVLNRGGSAEEAWPEWVGSNATYLVDDSNLTTLANLTEGPSKPSRTVYIKHTGITEIPSDFPWRVVDEHGVLHDLATGIHEQRRPHHKA